MGRRVRIFHISDLHARSTNGPQAERAKREASFRWRVIGTAWDDNIRELQADGGAVDLIVFTGDLGDWGHETDYVKGVDFLRRTCEALRVPVERLFVVPGNHDIGRKTEEATWRALREKMPRAELQASDWLAGGPAPTGFEAEWRDVILHRQASFWNAVTVGLGCSVLAPWQHRHRRLGYQVRVPLEGLDTPLWVVGLDSSWLAGDEHDAGKLWLTQHQVGLHTTDEEGGELPGFRLALMHHRFADLADGDRALRLLSDRVDLLLHGHQHEPMAEPWASPDHSLLVLAAGCLYEGDEHHRYPNACQMIDVELNDEGRPEGVSVRFRGWAERNGLFWGDDSLLYKSARGGKLELERVARGWQVRGEAPRVPPWMPASSEVFVGREVELKKLDEAMRAGAGARVAVVAVQGMAGVGKSFLVEQFCAQNHERFGTICRWVLDPSNPPLAAHGLLEISRQAGLDVDRIPPKKLAAVLNERGGLVHVDNVDGPEAASIVVDLLGSLPKRPAIVTGRYMALGTTPGAGWQRVEVECLDPNTSVSLLRKELGENAPSEAQMRGLAAELGGLPLALHLAAGYLRAGYTPEDFLREFHSRLLTLPPVDPADPLSRDRSRGIVSVAFEISRKLFLAEAARRGKAWDAALSALGWAPLVGFGRSLGTAIADVAPDDLGPFLQAATALALVRRVPKAERSDDAWSVHSLVAEFLRAGHARGQVDERIASWVNEHGDGNHDSRGERWAVLSLESAAVHAWLVEADDQTLAVVLSRCWEYGSNHGPVRPWLDAARRASEQHHSAGGGVAWAWAQLAARVGESSEVLQAAEIVKQEGDGERELALAAGLVADVLVARGELDEGLRILREEALPFFERLGNVRSKAVTMGQIANILVARGELDEGLRILREEALPVYERLGDVREKAVTMGKIADILVARGELDEGLRILREEALPVYERLGDVREKAVTMGKIADILVARGELDEGLRILREEALPLFERLGDVREKAVTMGQIANILVARGELDEGMRIRREEELPVYERLGDVREKAVTMGKIADILVARGELDEGMRIRREEELPVYERLGDVREKAVAMGKIADILAARGELDEGLRILREEALPVYERLGALWEKAVTMGKIADVLVARGELDEGLRILREEALPVYKRLGAVRSKAVTMGKIADILVARGELDEGLRILREEALPVYERLGDVRSKAVTMGKIADILVARGELDEGLRILREEALPVYERLGDVRSKAVTMGKIADVLVARGELDEGLRILREEALPIYESLGGPTLVVGLANTAVLLIHRGGADDLAAAQSYLKRAVAMADAMRMPFTEELRHWLASNGEQP